MQQQTRDGGQIAVATAGVVALTLAVMLVFATLGAAVVHRMRARTAADAVALATVADDPSATTALVEWYRSQGVVVEPGQASARAESGPAQAASWATARAGTVGVAPAVVAVLARASQLLGRDFSSPQFRDTGVRLSPADAEAFAQLAGELGMCRESATDVEGTTFVLCRAP